MSLPGVGQLFLTEKTLTQSPLMGCLCPEFHREVVPGAVLMNSLGVGLLSPGYLSDNSLESTVFT